MLTSYVMDHDMDVHSGRESGGAPPLRIAMNIHSMKLFNNLIKNTLLAPMFCGLVKSYTLQCTLPARLLYT